MSVFYKLELNLEGDSGVYKLLKISSDCCFYKFINYSKEFLNNGSK